MADGLVDPGRRMGLGRGSWWGRNQGAAAFVHLPECLGEESWTQSQREQRPPGTTVPSASHCHHIQRGPS